MKCITEHLFKEYLDVPMHYKNKGNDGKSKLIELFQRAGLDLRILGVSRYARLTEHGP
jgi:hypothetical protein